jgi:hypothetical protein
LARIFSNLVADDEPPDCLMIDSTHLKYPSPTRDDLATPLLAGISNQGRNKEQPYVTAGDRTYLMQQGWCKNAGNKVFREIP